MTEVWLKCAVSKGMFSDEMAVEYNSPSGNLESFFVQKKDVQSGKLKVKIFKKGNVAWAVLPTENKAIIPVNEADVVNQ